MSNTIVALFDNSSEARHAEEQLIKNGFSRDSIKMHGSDQANYNSDYATDNNLDSNEHGGGIMERIRAFFGDMFDDDEDVGHYSEAVRRGGTVLSVTVDDDERVEEASDILALAGADNIDNRVTEWRQSGYTGYDESQQPYTADQIAHDRNSRVIPVIQEELEVGKRQVDLGSVRVYSRTVETPVNETIHLREQHASINRRPVDREATAEDLEAFKDDSIEIRETAEKAVVSKNARVVEEVEVDTEESTTSETINDTIRRTEVEVDRQNRNNSSANRSF